ncbi:hypothetical protein LMH87_000104 [Akanthomyces muscarius]|uniref:Uncharacterized protein n=1 Tax=Akanthomyces muscarius TaxID=2231603 RepID=A0A9W8QH95_AKAMU|nr:hypothetical protein LMH87_000104 [Akanthomyces muscarius]KAJ4154828.1 hypothetical protein LMH87_000104 [Akanthomyces muscarius]
MARRMRKTCCQPWPGDGGMAWCWCTDSPLRSPCGPNNEVLRRISALRWQNIHDVGRETIVASYPAQTAAGKPLELRYYDCNQ